MEEAREDYPEAEEEEEEEEDYLDRDFYLRLQQLNAIAYARAEALFIALRQDIPSTDPGV